MRRVVIDTNVLISGIVFGGPPGVLIDLVLEGYVSFLTSPELLMELEGVMHRKFPHVPEPVWDILAVLRDVSVVTIPDEPIDAVTQDSSDNRVLECAVAAGADAIVSGDRHLLSLKTFRSIPILTPQAFLACFKP
jgi:putative PIN family toxin of toxin-antitoxin system